MITEEEIKLKQLVKCLQTTDDILHDVLGAAKWIYGLTINIRREPMSEGMCKYHLIGLPFDAVLHHFTAPDTGYPHDHPWGFSSYVLKGNYEEDAYFLKGFIRRCTNYREAGTSHHVPADTIHRLTSLPDGECWTLVLPEPWQKEPGFYDFSGDKVMYRQWNEKEWRAL